MKKMNFQLELFWSEGWYDSKSVFGSLRMPFHNKNLLKENSRWQGPPVHVVVSRRPKTLRCVRDLMINVRTHVNFKRVNKIEAMYGRSLVNVKVDRG